MASNFPEIRVGDFARVKGGKRLPAGTALTSHQTLHPYLRIVDFQNGRIDESNLMYVPDDVFPFISRYVISKNDIYISIVGTVGLCGKIPEHLDGANLTENAAKICNIDKSMNRDFVLYFLQSRFGQGQIQSLSVGSTQPKLALFRIEEIMIPAPPLHEQKRIAHILGTLDDKIDLNRRMNATLEAIAQALFKSWFVDFDPVRAKASGESEESICQRLGLTREVLALFPDRLVESEMGEIPAGWEILSANEIADISIGKTPPRKEPQWFTSSEQDVPWVSIRDMGIAGAFITQTSEKITRGAVDRFNIRVVPADTVLLSFKLTIGRVSISTEEMTTNEAIAHFRTDLKKRTSFEYVFLYLKNFDFSVLGSTSSIAEAVNSQMIREMRFVIPDIDIVAIFSSKVHALFKKIKSNIIECRHLSNMRDTLLPKLLSGELSVAEASQAVGSVA